MKIEKLRTILSKANKLSHSEPKTAEELASLDVALKKFDKLTVKQLAKKLETANG